MKFHYQFVNFGSQAVEDIPDNEYWLDVGGKLTLQVLDHHFSDSKFMSTAEIVMNSLDRLASVKNKDITLVLHKTPDLDGIFSSWLLEHAITNPSRIQSPSCRELSRLVTLHDQGFEDEFDVENSWPITFYMELNARLKTKNDTERVKIGHAIIEESIHHLNNGVSIEHAARKILSLKNLKTLEEMKSTYEMDRNNACIFQISLPTLANPSTSEQVDAIAITDSKTGSLLKHFARRDKLYSPNKRGFTLLIVSTTEHIDSASEPRWRHIISVKPESNVNLAGLGESLEHAEQEKENNLELPLPQGRERIPNGTGRFGWNVASPWYDGRGHNFTIVDSPAITISNQSFVCSVLTPEEVIKSLNSTFNNPQ